MNKLLEVKYWLFGTSATISLELLDMLGLASVNVRKVLVAFILLTMLDWMSKRYQYVKYFGSIRSARLSGAWRSRVNAIFLKNKMTRYALLYASSALLIYSFDKTAMLEFDLNGFIINSDVLLILILLVMCSIEFQSIFENLTKTISSEEKAYWENPHVQPLSSFHLSEDDRQKYSMIHTLANAGFNIVLRVISLIRGPRE